MTGLTEEEKAALDRLTAWLRRRKLQKAWLELIEDLIDWNRLYKQLKQKKAEREAQEAQAAQIMQRVARNSPATNVAMRVASKGTGPEVIRATRTVNWYATNWVHRSRLKWEQERHAAFLAEGEALAASSSSWFGSAPEAAPGVSFQFSAATRLAIAGEPIPTCKVAPPYKPPKNRGAALRVKAQQAHRPQPEPAMPMPDVDAEVEELMAMVQAAIEEGEHAPPPPPPPPQYYEEEDLVEEDEAVAAAAAAAQVAAAAAEAEPSAASVRRGARRRNGRPSRRRLRRRPRRGLRPRRRRGRPRHGGGGGAERQQAAKAAAKAQQQQQQGAAINTRIAANPPPSKAPARQPISSKWRKEEGCARSNDGRPPRRLRPSLPALLHPIGSAEAAAAEADARGAP